MAAEESSVVETEAPDPDLSSCVTEKSGMGRNGERRLRPLFAAAMCGGDWMY